MKRWLAGFWERTRRGLGWTETVDPARWQPVVEAIEAREDGLRRAGDEALASEGVRLRRLALAGATTGELLVDTYALVRETARRVLGLRAFGVQLLAAVALHEGCVAEMPTGEGKTLAAVFPATLHALGGEGVHVLTFNDYLARRDAVWMGDTFRQLGLEVGCIQDGMSAAERRTAYAADLTYVTAKEAGFDHLRDGLATRSADIVHRPFHVAIVDEADSILIDEARVPLVIAGGEPGAEDLAPAASDLVRRLAPTTDWRTDTYARNVQLTEPGIERAEAVLGCGSLHDLANLPLLTAINHALHAEVLLRRDVDYIVRGGEVELVDDLTGRVQDDRRWPDGLHEAVAAKEGLRPPPDGQILGSVTLQHFLGLYPRLCGMTGTAASSARELGAFYRLAVAVIPPNRPCIRTDEDDVVFSTRPGKERALLREIAAAHAIGRPVLAGTGSVAESERLAALLRRAGVPCAVLNAKNDEEEAGIIARAGALGAVTISTNMAGRGTDIRLGGADGRTRDAVVLAGGLYVIGTQRHESPRIDHQLRGRAGRQGDPGSSRFFLSLEDDIVRRFAFQKMIPGSARNRLDDDPLSGAGITREIDRAQRIVDGQNFEIRKTLGKYATAVEAQRRVVRTRRDDLLFDRDPPALFGVRTPGRWQELSARFGEVLLRDVERKLRLFHLDRCWAGQLALLAHIREGVPYVTIAGEDPLSAWLNRAQAAFEAFEREAEDAAVASFLAAEITAQGIDLEKEGLKAPSSTWTYLINDRPFRRQGGFLSTLSSLLGAS